MPSYHSEISSDGVRVIGRLPVLPLKTKFNGPAPNTVGDGEDIVDEILKYFKANILFRNFEVKGDSDRLLIYGILFVSACLNKMVKKSKQEATSAITTLALEKFALPGDSNFPLGGLVSKPTSSADQDTIRQYLTQLRQEIGQRLIEKVYAKDASQPDKWWICFTKRKFLNLEMA